MVGVGESRMDTVLFDLDGTLLPMDQDAFLKCYMAALAETFGPQGYDPKALVGAVWKGPEAMVQNDGTMTNRERFWSSFSEAMGEDMLPKEDYFTEFYKNQFGQAKAATGVQALAAKAVKLLKQKGYEVILATNPLFPSVATKRRMKWAWLDPEDFSMVTTYEAETYCKPNLDYYRSILKRFGKKPEQCMMVGNDVDEDMCTAALGMNGYLITDCLLNRHEKPLEGFLCGTFPEFYEYVTQLPVI